MQRLTLKGTYLPLPSRGSSYGITLPAEDSVGLRPFLAGDQKIIATRGTDAYRLYFNLLSRVIVEPVPFPVDSLLLSDANAIMFAVRLMSLGQKYPVRYRCDNCESSERTSVDLTQIEIAYAEDVDGFNPEENQTTLPDSGDEVVFRLPTLGDERVVAQFIVSGKKKGREFNSHLDTTFVRIAQLVSATTGMEGALAQSLSARLEYLDKLSLVDINHLIDAVADRDVGIKEVVTCTCGSCGYQNDTRLALNEEFFRPNA